MAPKKKKGGGKKGGGKKAGGDEGAYEGQRLKPVKGCNRFQHNDFILDAEDGRTIMHARGGSSDAALGVHVIQSGVARFTFTIHKSSNTCGYGIVLGVAEATDTITDCKGSRAWGINLNTARLAVTQNCYERGFLGKPFVDSIDGLKYNASGAVIDVEVSMDPEQRRRALKFGINGGPLIDACVQLPVAVRPWVLMTWEEDVVSLTFHDEELFLPVAPPG